MERTPKKRFLDSLVIAVGGIRKGELLHLAQDRIGSRSWSPTSIPDMAR